MNYYNINDITESVSFREATIRGQGRAKGLFFPEHIPAFAPDFIQNLQDFSDAEIAFQCMKDFVGDEIPEAELRNIVAETIHFKIPLVKINNKISVLELFHGPTLAFKDVGARFMSRCLSYFLKDEKRKVTVLVATSGDTGGAVANGFYKVPNVEVVILYPKNRVSAVQEKQLTTLGENIRAVEVSGSFDDCQRLVKQAFADENLREKILLTSANSINVARWLPQQIYYLLAQKQWNQSEKRPPVISVPSGNFGNICAGLLAYIRGLPADHFIAACNANDSVPRYLETGCYEAKKAVATHSNAMDVGDPSNFVRILELFGRQFSDLKAVLSADSVADQETLKNIAEVQANEHYLLDPHGAVAYTVLQEYLKKNPAKKGYFLETAHPVKFPEAVEEATGICPSIPGNILDLMEKKKKTIEIEPDFEELKRILQAEVE